MKKIIVEERIFEVFPGFIRGVIVTENIENRIDNKYIAKLLSTTVEKRRQENLLTHPLIKAWDDAYRRFGSNPNKYPPSIKSLLKRIQKKGNIPFINSVVALFNHISLKYLIPCGGDDVKKIKGNLRLGFAKGNEIFTPLGSNKIEKPETGEVIYFDDKTGTIMCRRWNWRNSDTTKITEYSKNIVINVDGIPPADETLITQARDELAMLLEENCNARLKTFLISNQKPIIENVGG